MVRPGAHTWPVNKLYVYSPHSPSRRPSLLLCYYPQVRQTGFIDETRKKLGFFMSRVHSSSQHLPQITHICAQYDACRFWYLKYKATQTGEKQKKFALAGFVASWSGPMINQSLKNRQYMHNLYTIIIIIKTSGLFLKKGQKMIRDVTNPSENCH